MKLVTLLPVLSEFVFEKLVMCNWFISLPVIKEKKQYSLLKMLCSIDLMIINNNKL